MTRYKFQWRAHLQALALLAVAGIAPTTTHAAAPLDCRAVHIVAPNPPGGATDVLSRLISDPLSQRVGVPVIVDNKGGASTSIGNEFVARSPPDGCTLLLGNISMALNKSLMKLNYEVERDLRGVSFCVSQLHLAEGLGACSCVRARYRAATSTHARGHIRH